MSQPLEWWKEYYAGLLYQGVVVDLDEIKGLLGDLIKHAQEPFNVENSGKA
jgi:hypothetical protein